MTATPTTTDTTQDRTEELEVLRSKFLRIKARRDSLNDIGTWTMDDHRTYDEYSAEMRAVAGEIADIAQARREGEN